MASRKEIEGLVFDQDSRRAVAELEQRKNYINFLKLPC